MIRGVAPMTDRSLDTYLKSAKELARLSAHAARLLKLQEIYARVAPPNLAEASQVANYQSGKVLIHAANGAVAAKLSQLASSLRDDFCKFGGEVTEISVRVQAGLPRQPVQAAVPVREISATTVQHLDELRRRLPEGSPVAGALERLLNQGRHGR